VKRQADGKLEYLGRLDTQVKVRGYRIELGEIEAVVEKHPCVKEAVVVVREEPRGHKQLVGYVVTEEGRDESGAVRAYLQERLPEYMVPGVWVCLKAFPVTQNGKVDRKALPAPDLGAKASQDFVAPKGVLEELVAGIWAQVLGLERVSARGNFFELGGHSLLAMQMISRVRETFDVDLPFKSLFGAPTVAGLARSIEAALAGGPGRLPPPMVPVPREGELLTSFAQYRLWFLDQLQTGGSSYNVPLGVRLLGRLELSALERSLQEIIRRHEALRTVFASSGGRVVQVISPEVHLPLTVESLEGLEASEREREAQRRAGEEAQRPFELSRGPLLRATVLRLAKEEHVLVLVMHHVITDGWSINVLLRELSQLYPVFAAGEVPALPALALQYADFAAWQRQWLQGDVLEAQRSYWKQTLAGAPQALELPTDRPRPQVQTFHGAQVRVQLPLALSQEVRALSHREGATLFMTLLAAFQALLARYSGQTDIVVGSPIAGRNRQEVEGLIGLFVNTLALRAEVQGSLSFQALLAQVREACLGAYAHQDLPFEQVVEALQLDRDLSRTPLFQVMFVLESQAAPAMEFGGLSLKPLDVDLVTAKFDLTVGLQETPQGLLSVWEYNTGLFDRETVARMAGHFQKLLEGLTARPEQAISRISLLSEAERTQVLEVWARTAGESPQQVGIHRMVEAQAERAPEALAVKSPQGQVSYGELNARANQLAHALREKGVGPEDRVVLCMERSVELVTGALGILKAGGAYVPLDPVYPVERLRTMAGDSRAQVVVTQGRLKDAFEGQGLAVVCLDDGREDLECQARANLQGGGVPENLAYVIYTSGSTGKPKGVEVSHASLANLVAWHQREYAVTPEDRATLVSGPAFDASVWELWPYLTAGASLHIPGDEVRAVPARLLEWMAAEGVTLSFLPTPLAEVVLAEEWPEGLALRALLTGGDRLRRRLRPGQKSRLMNHYGPTENTVVATWAPVVGEAGTLPPIGRPIANAQAYVLDKGLHPVPVGVGGELFIGGDSLARGYLDRPELTAEKFLPNPFSTQPGSRLYRTGDLVRWSSAGELEFLGRVDQQVKIRGYRIELGEIEAVLAQHPAVREAVVVVRESGPEVKQLVGYAVAQGGERPSKAELRTYLRERLPEAMVPSAIVLLDALPVTPNGKVDRRALPVPDEGYGSDDTAMAPQTDFERAVAAIWQEVLHVAKVGTNDRFFDLGGNSLTILEVQKKLSAALSLDVKLTKLFQYPTIASLAQHLAQGEPGPAVAAASPQRAKRRQELDAQGQARRRLRTSKKDAQDE
ncbi:non-ribosomal peptide synthetase, partial [Stigmatella erecta]|uniref:non-ribosomal peptide synthetase n=1 Tax=Stigmatella erecta TaxID=83460 RepID=UPI00116039A6